MRKVLATIVIIVFLIIGVSYIWLHGVTKKIFIPHFTGASAATNSIQQYLFTLQ